MERVPVGINIRHMGAGNSRVSIDDASSTWTSVTTLTSQPSTETATTASDLEVKSASQSSLSSITTKEKKKPPENESGYDKAQRVCRKQKRKYDACYTAQLSSKEEDCNDLFEAYRTCFLRIMAKDMEKRGVNVNESSMIGEYNDEMSDKK